MCDACHDIISDADTLYAYQVRTRYDQIVASARESDSHACDRSVTHISIVFAWLRRPAAFA